MIAVVRDAVNRDENKNKILTVTVCGTCFLNESYV